MFITAFKSARHLSLSLASSIQSIPPHSTSLRSSLIWTSHLRLGLPSGLLPSGFPIKTLYTTLFSPIRATCPAYLILHECTTRTKLSEQYRSLNSSLYSLIHSPVTTSLLGPNNLLNTLLSNTVSLRSSLNVSDQVSHPCKTTSKIIVDEHVYIFYIELQNSRGCSTQGMYTYIAIRIVRFRVPSSI